MAPSKLYEVKLQNGYQKGLKQRDLVNVVILDYFTKNPKSTLPALQRAFPKRVQKKLELVVGEHDAHSLNKDGNGKTRKQYHIFDGIKLPNGEALAICNQWGVANIDNFVNHAKQMGYAITTVDDTPDNFNPYVEQNESFFRQLLNLIKERSRR